MSLDIHLDRLYHEISNCHVCPEMNMEKALRLREAVNPLSDVFIIGQSLAEGQVRITGLPFFEKKGDAVALGATGKRLEGFLNEFGRTLYPHKEVTVFNVTLPSKSDRRSVYSTDIVQCYPGKKGQGQGNRQPLPHEIDECICKGFLIREIELITPKLLLLMGKVSWKTFFRDFLDERSPDSLSTHIAHILTSGKIPFRRVKNLDVHVLLIQHASLRNALFLPMAQNKGLVRLIRQVLDS